jgi:hypothetical protein
VTSGTGLNPDAGMPMPKCGSLLPEEMPIPDYLFSGIPDLHMLFY